MTISPIGRAVVVADEGIGTMMQDCSRCHCAGLSSPLRCIAMFQVIGRGYLWQDEASDDADESGFDEMRST